MPVDMSRMKKDRKRTDKPKGKGVEIFKPDEGEYLLYITPPVHDQDPVPYVEVMVHFSMGPNNRMILNAEDLEGHGPFLKALEARGMSFEDARGGWELAQSHANKHSSNNRIQLRPRWYFGVLVMASRRSNRDEWEWEKNPEFQVLGQGKSVYNGITDVFFDVGDITDPDKAVLIKLGRKGKGLETEYSVSADVDTLRDPMSIDDKIWDKLEPVLKPGEDGDLYKLIAAFCKDEEGVQAVLDGTDRDESEKAPSRPAVRATPATSRRRRPSSEVEEVEEEEQAEEEEKPKRGRRRKPVAEADDESSTASEGSDSDIEELEKALKSRSRRRRSA